MADVDRLLVLDGCAEIQGIAIGLKEEERVLEVAVVLVAAEKDLVFWVLGKLLMRDWAAMKLRWLLRREYSETME